MTGLRLREEGLGRERLATEDLRVPGWCEEHSRHGFIWMFRHVQVELDQLYSRGKRGSDRWSDLP